MEILSIGEKIKRSRIYKGFTLKEVCNEELSVSKLSCIENGKIKSDDNILKYIAKKLDIDFNYLKQDIRQQLEAAVANFEKGYGNEKTFVHEIQYFINLSEENQYYDLALRFIHFLFIYYLENNNFNDLYSITTKYYDFYQKNSKEEITVIYYLDMAKYLFINNEFVQASAFFSDVKVLSKKINNMELYTIAIYNEAVCYYEINNFEKAYKLICNIENLIKYVKKDIDIAEIYRILAMLSIRLNREKFDYYKDLSYKYYENDKKSKAVAMFKYAIPLFEIGEDELATYLVIDSLEIFPKEDKKNLTEFMIEIVKVLIDNNSLNLGEEICQNALNNSIEIDDIKLIERSYYFNAKILEIKKQFSSAEMYMNLSLDFLVKFGDNKSISKRYFEMGYMYYNLGQVNDALNFFNLAISIEKSI
ncbi:MAG: helix-turn-helix transcriptional regulator [Bacillota bacterium]|nr:helix-turn-helix transcriptional regulator [Bacillota bacterium]